jgi:hypothetical protein
VPVWQYLVVPQASNRNRCFHHCTIIAKQDHAAINSSLGQSALPDVHLPFSFLRVRYFLMGAACVKPRVAAAANDANQRAKSSVKGGSVAGASAAGRSKNGGASAAGAGIRNQVLQKIKADTENMGVTGVNAALGLDYIRMENKLLEKNIERVLSMVGNDGRTVSCKRFLFTPSTNSRSARFLFYSHRNPLPLPGTIGADLLGN